MNFEEHTLIGIIVSAIYWFTFCKFILGIDFIFSNILSIIGIFLLFTNLPDIDNSNSKITTYFALVYFFLLIIFWVEKNLWGLPLILFVAYHAYIAKDNKTHRAFPHTLAFGFLASCISLFFVNYTIAIYGFTLFTFHLIVDNRIKLWSNPFPY